MSYVIFEGHYDEEVFNNVFTLEKIGVANLKKSIPYCLIKLYNKKLEMRRKLYHEGKIDFDKYYHFTFIIMNVEQFINNEVFEMLSDRNIILNRWYFFIEKLKGKYNDHLTFIRNRIYHSFFKDDTLLTIELEVMKDETYKTESIFSAVYRTLSFSFTFSTYTFYNYMAFSSLASYQNAGSILYNNLYEVYKDTLSNLKQFNDFKEIWIYILSNFIKNVENEKTKLYTSKEYETIEIIDDYLSKAEKILNFIKKF